MTRKSHVWADRKKRGPGGGAYCPCGLRFWTSYQPFDSEMIAWLERLRSFSGAIVMVTHDRYFLERACNRIAELQRGSLFYYEANYSQYLELKLQREEMEQGSERKRQAILRREYQWISRGCRARSTKSTERIERYEALKEKAAPDAEEKVSVAAGFPHGKEDYFPAGRFQKLRRATGGGALFLQYAEG